MESVCDGRFEWNKIENKLSAVGESAGTKQGQVQSEQVW